MRRRPLLAALPGLAVPAALGAAASDAAAGGKTLRLAFRSPETTFDPTQTNSDGNTNGVLSNIFDSPLAYDYLARPVRLRLATAAAMPEVSADGKVFTVHLRPGIYFSDDPAFKGRRRELVAQDHVYSIKRFFDPRWNSSDLYIFEGLKLPGLAELRDKAVKTRQPFDYDTDVDGVRALDRYTLRIQLGEADPRFLWRMADPVMMGALAREVVEAYGDDVGAHPVGTGPFRLKSWRRGSRIELERSPSWRGMQYEGTPADDPLAQAAAAHLRGRNLPLVDRVVVDIIEEDQPRWLSFLQGRHDLLEVPGSYRILAAPGGRIAPYLAKRGVRLQAQLQPDIVMSFFFMEHPLVGGYTPEKVALRRAISLAFDGAVYADQIFGGFSIPAQSTVPPHCSGFDATYKSEMSDHDPARARALLDTFGYVDRDGDGWREQPDGQPLVLVRSCGTALRDRRANELWKRSMDAIGLRIEFEPANWPELLKKSRAGTMMMWGYQWSAGSPDGGFFLGIGYGPNASESNDPRFMLSAFDRLFERQRALPDGPEREAVMRQAKNLMVAYMPFKVHGHNVLPDLVQPWTRAYWRHPFMREPWSYVDVEPGEIVMKQDPRMAQYQRWLDERRGLRFESYDALWNWSVNDLAGFWSSIWDFFDLHSPTPWRTVLEAPVMPGANWFPGAQVNFAQQVLRHADAAHAAGHPAIVFQNERTAAPAPMSWPELRRQVGAFAARLREAGVVPGDRVCAYLPNTPHTVVAFLATVGLGAIWSVCSPDMGPVAVLDRFRQIAPKVLVAVDGQVWGGKQHDRRPVLREVLAGLPSVQQLVFLADVDGGADAAEFAAPGRAAHRFADWTAGDVGDWAPAWLPFDHPLWVVYSSGTTGLPKPIVHGHGGIVLEFLKGTLHNDVSPTVGTGERFHWFSSTGWIMWNAQLGALLNGTTIALYDGNPGGPAAAPDWGTLWRFADAAGVSWFGAGAAFYASCLKAGVQPMQLADLSRLHAIGSTGSPLSDECYRWIWDQLPQADGEPIWLNPISGGTDFAGAFVAGNRLLPVTQGEMQCRCLGAAVQAFSEDGRPLIDEVGELVCTQPMPSMPLYFWGDESGARYRDSYFDMFPGGNGKPAVWRHGDWIRITPHPESGSHGAVIYGRSDATINRHGIRMGTAELYRAVEAQPEVLDSLVVDLEYLGRESWMPLFVVLREGLQLDDALTQRLNAAIRTALSARHVPNAIHQVAAIPRTLSGKKMELPVKKLLLGAAPEQVFHRDAMANADCVDWFIAYARSRAL